MKNSAIRQGLYHINTNYYDYFVTNRHPVIATITTILFWLIWTAIVVAFFSLLYFNHNYTFFSIIGILIILELTYQFAKK